MPDCPIKLGLWTHEFPDHCLIILAHPQNFTGGRSSTRHWKQRPLRAFKHIGLVQEGTWCNQGHCRPQLRGFGGRGSIWTAAHVCSNFAVEGGRAKPGHLRGEAVGGAGGLQAACDKDEGRALCVRTTPKAEQSLLHLKKHFKHHFLDMFSYNYICDLSTVIKNEMEFLLVRWFLTSSLSKPFLCQL